MPRRFIIEWTLLLILGLVVIAFAYFAGTYLIMIFATAFYIHIIIWLVRDIKRHRKENNDAA